MGMGTDTPAYFQALGTENNRYTENAEEWKEKPTNF